MPNFPSPPNNSRLGFHYFPDLIHFRESDLSNWIPELKSLGISWLTLLAPLDRAIPEYFIKNLIAAGIEPVLHFNFPLALPPKVEDSSLLFETYSRWGAHYAVIFDRPNRRASWPVSIWTQSDLVERFLDRFLPLAEIALQSDLIPVFPPLTPGGDYWDTAFLRDSLQSIDRRGHYRVLENLAIGAYAIPGDRALDWGSGGPERWPAAHPYHCSPDCQDHRSLSIHEWYTAIAQAVIGESRPQLLFGLNCRNPQSKSPTLQDTNLVHRTVAIAQALVSRAGQKNVMASAHTKAEGLGPFPDYVLAGNFWLLSADPQSPHHPLAWFHADGVEGYQVKALRQWKAGLNLPVSGTEAKSLSGYTHNFPIHHYLLLPTFEWGTTDWHLNAARPFIRKHQPTIGFSINEAQLASRVTVLGNSDQFSDTDLDALRAAGCIVEWIDGDGISIATQLVDR